MFLKIALVKKSRSPYGPVSTHRALERERIAPFRALRTVTESENEAHDEQTKVEVVDGNIGDIDPFELKCRVFQHRRGDVERDVVVYPNKIK